MQLKVNVICGPTASGKTSKAIEEALKHNGVIINADSQQVYKDLPILTAMPSFEDMQKVPHKLFAFIDGTERMDVSKWCEFAAVEIKKAFEAGMQPYVVGGTGFYIKALVEGLSVIPSVPDKIRKLVFKEGLNSKCIDLHNILKTYDPDLANKVSVNDRYRILRGIEVFRATGVPLSEWQRNKKIKPLGDMQFDIDLLDFSMGELEDRIKIRTASMFDMGVIEEVEALFERGYHERSSVFKILGVKEIKSIIDGEISIDEAMAKIILITRQYAKRQRTFFKTQLKTINTN